MYGSPDNAGASVISNPVRPQELATTIYHALDIPLHEPQNNTGIAPPHHSRQAGVGIVWLKPLFFIRHS